MNGTRFGWVPRVARYDLAHVRRPTCQSRVPKPLMSTASIRSLATACNSSSLLVTCPYSDGARTPSSAASLRIDRPSNPSASTIRSAARWIRARLSTGVRGRPTFSLLAALAGGRTTTLPYNLTVFGFGRRTSMDFTLSTEETEVRDWVRTFVRREIVPFEPEVLRRERAGQPGLTYAELTELQAKAREAGFWGIQTPEEYGGMGLSAVMTALLEVELGRSFVPFRFGGAADNILFHANDDQKRRYLLPTIEGERLSCFAITEPGAGSDARNIRTSAYADGDDWIITGEKTFITGGNEADFTMVFAVTDKEKGANGGVTCFLVDRDMGWKSEPIPTMGEWGPAALVFDQVRVPAENILGEL